MSTNTPTKMFNATPKNEIRLPSLNSMHTSNLNKSVVPVLLEISRLFSEMPPELAEVVAAGFFAAFHQPSVPKPVSDYVLDFLNKQTLELAPDSHK